MVNVRSKSQLLILLLQPLVFLFFPGRVSFLLIEFLTFEKLYLVPTRATVSKLPRMTADLGFKRRVGLDFFLLTLTNLTFDPTDLFLLGCLDFRYSQVDGNVASTFCCDP